MNAPVVLLVDDHEDTRDMYAVMFHLCQFTVAHASDGAEALNCMETQLPSVVVTDLRMPGKISALDLCRHMSAKGIPVIALTGVAPGSEHHDARAAGCATVLLKPVAPDALVTEVRRVLSVTRPKSRELN